LKNTDTDGLHIGYLYPNDAGDLVLVFFSKKLYVVL